MGLTNNITLYRGTTWNDVRYAIDQAGNEIDLTDFTPKMVMKKSYESKIGIPFECYVTNAAIGEISIYMPATLSETIKAGRYVYDLIITNETDPTDKIVLKLMDGIVTVYPTSSL